MKLVLVEWEDAVALDLGETWVTLPKAHKWKPHIVKTTGFLVYDGPEGVIVTESLAETHIGQRQQIPRGMIRSVIVLPLSNPKKGSQ